LLRTDFNVLAMIQLV